MGNRKVTTHLIKLAKKIKEILVVGRPERAVSHAFF